MLSEEEKQAIKECERLSKEDYYGDSYFPEKYSIQILLNLLEKQQEENEELRKGQKSLMQSRKKWKDRYYKLREKNRKIIDKMAENKEEIEKIEEIDFLMKIREISKTHTCSYGAILNLLLEIILHFSTKELVDILEAKRFL